MQPEARVAELEAENDELYTELGKESPRMAREREAREAEEAKQRELVELAVKELPRYVDELLPRSDGARVRDEKDRAFEAVSHEYAQLKGVMTDQREAVKEIEALTRTFGGALPSSWQEARGAWIERQPRRDQPSASLTWRRDRFSKLLQSMFGRL
jgi:hypothetical protein